MKQIILGYAYNSKIPDMYMKSNSYLHFIPLMKRKLRKLKKNKLRIIKLFD